MTKLERAEEWVRKYGESEYGELELSCEECKAIADELDRLLAIIAKDERGTGPLRREIEALRAELAALKGEAARTVYVAAGGMHGAVDEMMNHNFHTFAADAHEHALPGESVWAVRTTARKVQP